MVSISFCATGKSGLGHLRRTANIAYAIRKLDAASDIILLTNAPSVGLPSAEAAIFDRIERCERAEMAARLSELGGGAVVVDTAVLPGLGSLTRPLCLVLRETPADKLATFRLRQDRPWDLIIVPNSSGHWKPDTSVLPAARVEAVGWIYRPVAPTTCGSVLGGNWRHKRPVLLLASGGGGTSETARALHGEVGRIVAEVRGLAGATVEIVQCLGPRAPGNARLPLVDRIVDPGPNLHHAFAEADLVISTAGYNSVLELAQTDTPTLLVSIARTFDDQEARVREWGARIGLFHEPGDPQRSADWIVAMLSARRRRPALDLGPSGARRAAELILGLNQCA